MSNAFQIRSFLDVPVFDPEDARRRKLLNIMLIGLWGLSLLGLIGILAIDLSGVHVENPYATNQENPLSLLYSTAVALLVGISIIYAINRYLSGWLASAIFLMFLTVVFIISDDPPEVVNGRSIFFFAIPILMASMLIRPYASFIATGVISVALTVFALNVQLTPNIFAELGFVVVAAVSWLSSRNLENALKELRITNQELDQRVADRTRELSLALMRERAEASKNQAILEGIADGVIVFDNAGKALVANPAIGRLLNYFPEQILGTDVVQLTEQVGGLDGDRERILSVLRHPEGSSNVRFQWNKKILLMNAAPVLEGESGRVGTVAVFRDFTQEAEIERMKDAFLAIVSHELRTPLNAVIGYAEMLREAVYGPMTDRQVEVINRIMNNTHRLLELVSDLLDQAQIESGAMKFQNRAFSPYELLEGMHSVMDRLAADKGLQLTSTVDQDTPTTLFGDPRRIQQVLINLVGNAIKFTERGSVTVKIYRADKSCWAMRVCDTGQGISAGAQKYIFEPFRQAEDTSVREHSGIGLGLSIVKRIIDLMGGEILVKSAPGKGSTFTVVMPFIPPNKENKNE